VRNIPPVARQLAILAGELTVLRKASGLIADPGRFAGC
jgi:hypothetical protein